MEFEANRKRLKKVLNEILNSPLLYQISNYWSFKNFTNDYWEKLESIKKNLSESKYFSGREVINEVRGIINDFLFFAQKRSPIYFTIINLRSTFEFSVGGLENLALEKDWEINDELIVNTCEKLGKINENPKKIVCKELKSRQSSKEIKKTWALDHEDFQPFCNEKNMSKRNVKQRHLCFTLLDRRKLSKSIRQIDACLLKDVVDIIGEYGTYENNTLDINFDTLPIEICCELRHYIKNNKKTGEKKKMKGKNSQKDLEKYSESEINEEDSNICMINISSCDEKFLPNIKDSA